MADSDSLRLRSGNDRRGISRRRRRVVTRSTNKKFIASSDSHEDIANSQDSSTDNTEVEGDADINEKASMLGRYITEEYALLKSVLRHLPLRDLHAAAKVCTTWKNAVEVIQRSRLQPHTFLWECFRGNLYMEEVPYEMFSKHFFSEPQLCLVFMTRKINNPEISCREAEAPCPKGSRNCSKSHRILQYVQAELEPECPCVAIEAYGVIGSTYDLSLTTEIEEYAGYSGVLLPKAPGIKIRVFQLNQDDCYRLHGPKCLSTEEIHKMTGIPPTTEPLRCLLLFSRDQHCPAIQNLVKSLEIRQGGQFAIGGGFFENVNVHSLRSPYIKRVPCILGIAFSGEGVYAASTILGSDILNRTKVEDAMDELRSCQIPSQESIGFMFACVGRGRKWYKRRNIESQSFRQHFPSTPLVGYFGAGEIGRKFIPVPEQNEKNVIKLPKFMKQPQEPEEDQSLIHSYTSIFVYLSFNRHTSV